ncbi:putative f-box domain containing protein [Ilyonectria robusta]
MVLWKKFASILKAAAIIGLFAQLCHAQYQPIQGPGSMMEQADTQQLRSIAAWNSSVSYSRIRITTRDDIESLYPIIAAYVIQPSLADSVAELVLDSDGWPSSRTSYLFMSDINKELKEPPLPVREDVHAAIESYIRGLGLGDKATATMLDAVEWKKQHLKGNNPETPRGFNDQNAEFGLAASAVLISLCKNISTLYVGKLGWRSSLQDYLLKSNYGLLPRQRLQRLEKVEIIAGKGPGYDPSFYSRVELLDCFRYFHRLPAIHSVVMDGVSEYQANRDLFVPHTSNNIKRIHIGHAGMSSERLGMIIRIPKSLEELTVSLGGLWTRDRGLSMMFLKTVGKCLLEQKESLRVLDLDIDIAVKYREPIYKKEDVIDDEKYQRQKDEYYYLDEAVSNRPLWSNQLPNTREYGYTLGSLHDFKAMTHLSIGMKALLGSNVVSEYNPPFHLIEQPPFRLIDALPPNLEYLCLYGYTKGVNEEIDSHVQEFMEKKAERLPLLKKVRGIDETVVDLASTYSIDGPEEDLWKRPEGDIERDLDWVSL